MSKITLKIIMTMKLNMTMKIISPTSPTYQMIAEERAPMIKQPEVGATYDAFLNKPEVGFLSFIMMALMIK